MPATISEFDGVRFLHLGTPWVQGAMRMKRPDAIELEYVQRMMAWLLLVPDAPAGGHAVQLGLGAGAITRFCMKKLGWRCTAVEHNASVIGACRQWFRLPADGARLQVRCMDAADFVADAAHAGSVDALAVDLYDHEAAAPVLDSQAFYRRCRALLADGGVMSVNLFGRDASFGVSAQRIAAAFGSQRVAMVKPTREGNTIVLAWRGGPPVLPPRDEMARRALTIEALLGLPARKWLRLLQNVPERRAPAA